MIPNACTFDYDVRLPIGLDKDRVMTEISRILADYPEVKVEELNANPPSFCDPDHEMVGILQRNAEMTSGVTPPPIISLAGTDARLWRYP